MFTPPRDSPMFETPNATMHTLASPSLGAGELAVWRVEMAPGSTGPDHRTDREQAWVVLEGGVRATVDGQERAVAAGQTLVLPAGAQRRIASDDGVVALVSTGAGTTVTTPDGSTRPVPWAA